MSNETAHNASYNQMDNMMTMVFMTILVPIVTTFAGTASGTMMSSITGILSLLYDKVGPTVNAITIANTLTYCDKVGSWISVPDERENKHLIRALLAYIRRHALYSNKSNCNLAEGDHEEKDDYNEHMKSNVLDCLPEKEVHHDGFTMRYKKKDNTDANSSKTTKSIQFTVSSKKPVVEIERFIRQCYVDYIDELYKKEDKKTYLYKQIPSDSGPRYKKYPINNRTTFDSMFFPEKTIIMNMLDKLTSGELPKLSFLLHGAPGCGKTSTIKAIANHLGYSVIEVKLSFLMSDADLTDVFHNESLFYNAYNKSDRHDETDHVPLDKRIYILEDVDAECETIHERKIAPSVKKEKSEEKSGTVTKTSLMEMMMTSHLSKLSLSGILNTLDGVLEINGSVIVMTTNHPEKLDAAFTRPGRVNLSLRLQKMTASDAKKMMTARFGDSIDVEDYTITPAQLEAYCQMAADLKELGGLIATHK